MKMLTLFTILALFAGPAWAQDGGHAGHGGGAADAGHGTGTVVSVAEDGNSIMIDHGPIDAIGMVAMTMRFGAMRNVDLRSFSAGDPVAFMLKQGRDGSYRITAICNTQAADCVAGMGGAGD